MLEKFCHGTRKTLENLMKMRTNDGLFQFLQLTFNKCSDAKLVAETKGGIGATPPPSTRHSFIEVGVSGHQLERHTISLVRPPITVPLNTYFYDYFYEFYSTTIVLPVSLSLSAILPLYSRKHFLHLNGTLSDQDPVPHQHLQLSCNPIKILNDRNQSLLLCIPFHFPPFISFLDTISDFLPPSTPRLPLALLQYLFSTPPPPTTSLICAVLLGFQPPLPPPPPHSIRCFWFQPEFSKSGI